MKQKLLFFFLFLFCLSTARAAVLYVDGAGGSNANTGTGGWADAKQDIQAAINAAAAGDEIWVKAGTYLPTEDANGGTSQRDKTFYITTKDVKLYGGFAGTETLLSERNPAANVTTLSGDLDGAGGTDDAYHVLVTIGRTSACVVDGFTIRGGRADVQSDFTITALSINILRTYGGGMHNSSSSNPTVNNCAFLDNMAGSGAGMYNGNCSPAVSNCVFSGNDGGFGGGMYYIGSNAVVSNCLFVSNTANIGGGMYIVGSTLAISSCTFRANAVYNFALGGGIYMGSGTTGGTITNCILYGNNGGPANRKNIYKEAGAGTLTVSYSIIGDYDAGATNNYSVSNITTADPLFINSGNPAGADGIFRTADDGLRIGCASPARDAGTGTTPATDILGNARVGAMDMGAYEIAGTGCPLYVDGAGGNNANTGTSWASAKKDVQAAINAAASGDEIWVKAGTYLPTLDPNGNAAPTDPKDKSFYITTKDVKLYGGFAGTETTNTQRNPTTNTTILSGDLDGSGGTNDAYHVLLTVNRTSACVVDGFTISGGRADGSGTALVTTPATTVYRGFGGGIYNEGSSPAISSCILLANNGDNGGGMYNSNSNPTVTFCTFLANMISSYGGGICNYSSSPTLSFCIFSANSAGNNGGGMFNITSSNPVVSSCLFVANTAGTSGGGMYSITNSNPDVSSCTFSANTAGTSGGGIYYAINAGGSTTNCILYGNTGGPAARQNIYKDGASFPPVVSYSLIGDYDAAATNNYTATNILVADPLFVDAANAGGADGIFGTGDDGLMLQGCSPAINAGTGSTPGTDISGNNRVGTLDLGAYEYQGSPATPTLASGPTTTDSRTIQSGSTVSLGGCGTAIAEVLSNGAAPVEGILSATMYVHPTAPSANQTKYARRHYDISTSLFPSTATARITLYFTQADFDDYNTAIQGSGLPPLPIDAADVANNKANLRITQEHGTSSTGLPDSYSGWAGTGPKKVLITPTVSWSPLLSLWKVQFPVTGFSGFFVTSAISAPLPLELLRFSAKRVGETTNQLDWATGEEEGGSVFVVERSGDAKSFVSIGMISGKGSSSAYRFMDNTPLAGDNYYRLQLKESGKTGYSQTVLIKGEGTISGGVTLSPNPATAQVKVLCRIPEMEGRSASVWSAEGRLMTSFVLAKETVLDVRDWAAGLYLLRLADGSTLRFVKE